MIGNKNEGKITNIKNNYGSEKEFDQDFKQFLENRLVLSELDIGLKIKIILDIVFFPKIPSKFYMHLNPSECDLVIYSKLTNRQNNMWTKIRKQFLEIIEFYRFGKNEIKVPIVIIETKNEVVTSHDLLLYSAKADKIKNVFPFTKYFLVCNYSNKEKLTLARHGKYFDGIYILHKKQSGSKQLTNDADKLIKDIQEHIQKLINEQILIAS